MPAPQNRNSTDCGAAASCTVTEHGIMYGQKLAANVANAQTINVTLSGVTTGAVSGNLVIPMSILLGDTNGDRVVNSLDENNVVQALGTSGTNLNADVDGDGRVDSTDRKIVRRQLGNFLAAGLPLDD